MGPKVQAATSFVSKTGKKALIGSLAQIEEMLAGNAGTEVSSGGGLAL
jgi:carbamate kinase